MTKQPSPSTSPHRAGKLVVMRLTLIAYLVLYVGIALVIFLNCPSGIDESKSPLSALDVLCVFAGSMMIIWIIIALANISWLLTWRHLASKKELTMITNNRKLTRLETRLINVLGPQR